MKVLYLAPPRTAPDQLAGYTFIEEEVITLADHGVEIYLLAYPLSTEDQEQPRHPRINVKLLPTGKAFGEVLSTIKFLWDVRRHIPVVHLKHPIDLYRLARIERFACELIHAEGIEVIHSNFGWPGGYGGALAKLRSDIPLIATMRGMDLLVSFALDYGCRLVRSYDAAIRLLLKTANCTTHVSDFMRREALVLGARSDVAKTIRKGVDCNRFSSAVPLDIRDSKDPLILTVCSLTKRKGVDDILRALGLLANSHAFSFVVVGYGPELEDLKALSAQLSLSSRVKFISYIERDRIHETFAACDIFVLASILEASGNVILEAMASGRPVICTDSGGPAEYVKDGHSGYVVPVADPEGMADRLRILLEDRALREKIGRQARDRAVRYFSYSRMTEAIITTYNEVASQAHEPIIDCGVAAISITDN